MSVITRVQNAFLKQGISLSKKQDDFTIEDLVEHIWPLKTEIPLIRAGSTMRADGGYLIPNDIEGVGRVFSPGVAETMDFEQVFLDKGVPCEMLDGSVDRVPHPHPLASFQKLWLAGSSSPGSLSLDEWVQTASSPDEDLVLQMDIEGSEYEVIQAAKLETLQRFRILVIELHDLRSVMSRMGLRLFLSTIAKLRLSHEIVHAHPNNCCRGVKDGRFEWPDVLELTLLRRDRFSQHLGPASLPHTLDRDNTPNKTVLLVRGS